MWTMSAAVSRITICRILSILLNFSQVCEIQAFTKRQTHTQDSTEWFSNVNSKAEALYLTPLLEAGHIDVARQRARVNLAKYPDVESYSGYLTVNATGDSHLFFWFIPTELTVNATTAPVIMWLQGGPGDSSMYGALIQNGPVLVVGEDTTIQQFRWTKKYSMLYIDNPIDAGFSYTGGRHFDSTVTNATKTTHYLYTSLMQFYQLFPQYAQSKLFLVGESFGAQYATLLGLRLHNENCTQLAGLVTVAGFFEGLAQATDYSVLYHQMGLLDRRGANIMKARETKAKQYIQENNLTGAYEEFHQSLINVTGSLFSSGYSSNYNLLKPNELSIQMGYVAEFLNRADIQQQLHIGDRPFSFGANVFTAMLPTLLGSIRSELEQVLEHYPVLVLNGQLDLLVPYAATVGNLLETLHFSQIQQYLAANRRVIMLNEDPESHIENGNHNNQVTVALVKDGGRLSDALILGAGHELVVDKPRVVWKLLNDFIEKLE